ncbi:phage integrase central domain-containing protein [Nesterenkonia aerolata]|uniref:Core-binding (CB) domain-containing protein n=1 Tax=Nesterenkonia aerolata TaxID=3074079 RepID=A0ABU2DSD5_9MICC|nr:hypothetical protein [Nesterenkonia sp. LY-0111]MDR8019419.1 hypothetical protein [Nesterenkonia sp. LY-0111]
MAKTKTTPILNGRATIAAPTEAYPYWRITYNDPITGKRRRASGGTTRSEAEAKAAHLLGDYSPNHKRNTETPPTLKEVAQDWLATNKHRWNSRTYERYQSLTNRYISELADYPITQITPQHIRSVDVSGLKRGGQQSARRIINGIFGHATGWINHDVSLYSNAINISGNKTRTGRNKQVSKGDIPSARYVSALIITAYHTGQMGPLDEPDRYGTTINPHTGEKTYEIPTSLWPKGIGMTEPDDTAFIGGADQVIVSKMRRGMPKHYKNIEQRQADETEELASRFRQVGLLTALGAAGGIRVGEGLALRVRHFLTREQVFNWFHYQHRLKRWQMGDRTYDQSRLEPYRGKVEILEQASQGASGKVWITRPKMDKERTVYLPAFLPSWHGHTAGSHRADIASIIPRFADKEANLWSATDEEAIELWRHGFTPLCYLLWQRLDELWNSRAVQRHKKTKDAIDDFLDLLLFPTRNTVRKTRDGKPNTAIPEGWGHSVRIVEGTGSYQIQSNYANRYANPLYDYVSEVLDEWPEHRRNSTKRQGWTHHGLRHFAVSSRIQSGTPLPIIANQMGHKDAGFTLERYGHMMTYDLDKAGYEY